VSKDVSLEKGWKDGLKRTGFLMYFVNKMNPVILLSIICTW